MGLSKYINVIRGDVMRNLTKNIGKSYSGYIKGVISNKEINSVLICRPNHRLGNLILITPLIQEIVETFPDCKIDLFVKGNLGAILFKNYRNIDRIIQLPRKPFSNILNYVNIWIRLKNRHYDIAINVDNDSSSGRLSTQFSNSTYKIYEMEGCEKTQEEIKENIHIAKGSINNFRTFMSQLGVSSNHDSFPLLNLKLCSLEIEAGKNTLRTLVNNDKKTICIFTYATGKKCYSTMWWEEFYERLTLEYPQYNLIEILPVENVSQIAFKVPSFYSRDIRQIGALIANTSVFVGADSGIMHLASSTQIPTVGLFSDTDYKKYEPYGNQSLSINTKNTTIDDHIQILNKI
ncbi:MAG: glycosyltransferase family 9 protein, partial [Aquaticitalea sp.]